LRTLEIATNLISDKGLKSFTRTGRFDDIEKLSLLGNPLGNAGVKELAQSMARPIELNLKMCEIGDDGIIALAESPVLSRVVTLAISRNRVGDAGLNALIKSPWLGCLEFLAIHHNPSCPHYGSWFGWDEYDSGGLPDEEHARRIASRFPRPIRIL
jgi:hypothetical protein